jgi:D-alanine-D-alanine ligase
MEKKRILLLCGGGGPEHEISLISAKYIESTLSKFSQYELTKMELKGDPWKMDLIPSFDYVIPCIHGYPGETGDMQSYLELTKTPYFGAGPEGNKMCFNKITTKLWLSHKKIPVTPFVFLQSPKDLKKAKKFFKKNGSVFVKPSSQGSSVGCHLVFREEDLEKAVADALRFSPYALVEKAIKGRELEVSVFEYKNKIKVSKPGEVIITRCRDPFYSFREKYDPSSKATTEVVAQGLEEKTQKKIMNYAKKAFQILNLRYLSRIDFFMDEKIYLNEVNTFPGMTPISMFPKMMEASGISFAEFLIEKIKGDLHG